MTDRDLFIAALDHPDPLERAAWLDGACAGDGDRQHRVNILLRAHDRASQFLATPAAYGLAAEAATRTGHPADDTPEPFDVLALLTPSETPGHVGRLAHYEVLEVVGRGGMGVVLKALDPKLHRLVALKVMAPHLAASGPARQRFAREARAVAAVRNEHVVAIHDVQPDGPAPYLVMEFIGGMSLQDRLERTGPLDVKEVLRIGLQAACGLAAAHAQGLVHRDVKPANILLENGVERVKLSDFGLARATDDANLTQSGIIAGTPNYMSPEQANGSAVDARSDLFSLGSVLYALCAGHPPFRADTAMAVLKRVCDDAPRPLSEVNADVPAWLDAIVRKLLAKEPNHRFQTATQVAEILGLHLAHLQNPTIAPPPAAVVLPLPVRAEPDWQPLFEGSDRRRPVFHFVLFMLGVIAFVACILPGTTGLRLPLVGVGVVLVALAVRLPAWLSVAHKGRTVRFENSVLKGQRLLVDGRVIARGGLGRFAELRGTIPDGAGAGDEIRGVPVPGFLRFIGRLSVSEGTGEPAAAVARPSAAPAVGCLFVLLMVAGFGAALIFRDTLGEYLFRRGYVSALFLAFDAGAIALVTWLFCKKPDQASNRVALVLAFVFAVGGLAAGGAVWWTHLGQRGYAGTVFAWGILGMGLANIAINGPAAVRRRPGIDPQKEARQRRTARLIVAGFTSMAVVCLCDLFVLPAFEPATDRLVIQWNPAFVDRVTVERDGGEIDDLRPDASSVVYPYREGEYVVRGYRNGGQVYSERFHLDVERTRHVRLFNDRASDADPLLEVRSAEPTLTFAMTSRDHAFQWAGAVEMKQQLAPRATYKFEAMRNGVVLHSESWMLTADVFGRGMGSYLNIPRLAAEPRSVSLKPADGGFPKDVSRMQFSPDGALVAAARRDGPIVVFDTASGRERFTVRRSNSDCTAFGFSPDGRALAFVAAAVDGAAAVYLASTADGKPTTVLTVPPDQGLANSHALAFSPDGKRLVVGSTETDKRDRNRTQVESSDPAFRSRLLRWQLAGKGEPQPQPPFDWVDGRVTGIAFTPDGRFLRTVGGRDDIASWDWGTGRAVQDRFPLDGGVLRINALTTGEPAALFWAETTSGGAVYQWANSETAADSWVLVRTTSHVAALAVTPDGKKIACGLQGNAQQSWEHRAAIDVFDLTDRPGQSMNRWQPRVRLLGHTDWVMAVRFSPDGREVTSASKDGTARTWRLP